MEDPRPEMVTLQVQLLGDGGVQPTQAYVGDVGWDLHVSRHTVIPARSFRDVPTDIAVAIPHGYWGRITGRSSTVRKRRLLVNEGIIDSGYRGELFVAVWNLDDVPHALAPGDRIAQLLIHSTVKVVWFPTRDLPSGDRGKNGFGSSG